MRIVRLLCIAVGFALSAGCGSDSPSDSSPGAAVPHDASSAPSPSQDTGPAVLGIDAELRREMRLLIEEYIEQNPSATAGDVDAALNATMDRVRGTARDFGIEPDASGNIEWPASIKAEMVDPLRAEFDARTLFDSYDVYLPPWVAPLREQHKAGTITPARSALLFRLASAEIIGDMT